MTEDKDYQEKLEMLKDLITKRDELVLKLREMRKRELAYNELIEGQRKRERVNKTSNASFRPLTKRKKENSFLL